MQNKKVLITGGSLGIGKATAKAFIEQGATVVITGRNQERIEAAANEIGAIPLVFDIADLDHIPQKAAEAINLLGGQVDVLVNNAGVGTFAPLGEITKAHFFDMFNTNVFGLTLLTQELLPALKTSKGTIINIGSTAAQKGFSHGSVYSATKFAVRSLTQSWQAELRPHNIRVCLVNPSAVTTAFNNDSREERETKANMLDSNDIAHTILSVVNMHPKGFIPEVTVWATNPF